MVAALSYSLYRGRLGAFTDTDKDGAADSYGTCLMSALASTVFADAATPPAGAAFFYLVTARYAAGEGTLGFASSGAERPNTQPCP